MKATKNDTLKNYMYKQLGLPQRHHILFYFGLNPREIWFKPHTMALVLGCPVASGPHSRLNTAEQRSLGLEVKLPIFTPKGAILSAPCGYHFTYELEQTR